ncbi:MAG: PDZ domain-containing protein [Gemmatimonadaceae bacterium]
MKEELMARSSRLVKLLVVIASMIPLTVGRAQGTTAWTTSTGYLGIENFRCDCTIGSANDTPDERTSNRVVTRRFQFRSAPMILGILPGSAGDGILARGDVITHINGQSIVTNEGARRFASIGPDEDVNLTVQRGARSLKAVVHTKEPATWSTYSVAPEASGYSTTWNYPATVPSVPAVSATAPVEPRAPRPPRAPRAASPPVAQVWTTAPAVGPLVAPEGWFGFSIRCVDCGWARIRSDSTLVWESNDEPEIAMVSAASPAGRAGLRSGDVITHIDGTPVMSSSGSRKFGSVVPGQKVRLTLRRGRSSYTRDMTLTARPEARTLSAATVASSRSTPRSAPTPSAAVTIPRASTGATATRVYVLPTPAGRRELRYSGQLDNVSVEVWSTGGPSVEKIGDTMIITVGSSVVRLKVDPEKKEE